MVGGGDPPSSPRARVLRYYHLCREGTKPQHAAEQPSLFRGVFPEGFAKKAYANKVSSNDVKRTPPLATPSTPKPRVKHVAGRHAAFSHSGRTRAPGEGT